MSSVRFLQRWLCLVASLRLFSVYIGYFDPETFKIAVVDLKPELANDLFGRMFATWTIITCMLCLTCAWNPRNKAVYGATLFSFVIALQYFLLELFVYKTLSWKGAASPFIVASISTLWMGLGYRYYTFYSTLKDDAVKADKKSS